ncbi:hypothetical protein E2562_023216 [Oryza meyeriana var. granulata]|uniref:Uncharacterized protein n=1 Tax=Oryza meyeriana var. granulata TaxID=110450 RepID=A0A6G1BZY5_9ORYZ|nr:hypothetical protein E2562_023216 [Oryza meyeriana var. granulata]
MDFVEGFPKEAPILRKSNKIVSRNAQASLCPHWLCHSVHASNRACLDAVSPTNEPAICRNALPSVEIARPPLSIPSLSLRIAIIIVPFSRHSCSQSLTGSGSDPVPASSYLVEEDDDASANGVLWVEC